jgi:hypothetical protein
MADTSSTRVIDGSRTRSSGALRTGARRAAIAVLLVVGVALMAAAAIWRPVVAPALTKLPNSLNETVYFEGAYTGDVNQVTGAALPAPVHLPLQITRHVQAVPGESTSAVLIVNDASVISIGSAKSSAVAQYAVDRLTEKDVASPHSYALVPSNVTDRAGNYSLGPPLGVNPSVSYPVWIDQDGRAIPLVSAHASTVVDGLSVQRWQQNIGPTPMPASIVAAMKLPPSMTFKAFEAELEAHGVDLAAVLSQLSPSLTAAQRASLAAATARPIPLQYLYATSAQILVEPSTGAFVDVLSETQAYSVRPVLTGLTVALTPILAAHASNPQIAKLIDAVQKMDVSQAQPLYSLTFHQTQASVTATAGTVGHNAALLQAVGVWIPVALGVAGLVLAGLGVFVASRGRARRRTGAATPATEQDSAI